MLLPAGRNATPAWQILGRCVALLCLALGGLAAPQNGLGQGSEATTVATHAPAGAAYDGAGNLFLSLKNDHTVVEVDTQGLLTTVAGTGEQGFGGDGGAAAAALLDSPSGVAVDANGNVYIADTHNHRIREVVNGIITTLAGTGRPGYSGDGANAVNAQLSRPTAVSVDASGNVYVADTDNHCIRKISGGIITTVAGDGEQGFLGDGGTATSAALDSPAGVVADPTVAGRFYFSDTHNQRIRAVGASGIVSTLAGTGRKGFAGNGTAATTALLARPRGLSIDPSTGLLSFADSDNNLVRSIQGTTISTLLGTGEQGFFGDTGSPLAATLDTPTAVSAYPGGLTAVTDTRNDRARTLGTNSVNTVAGIPPMLTEGLLLSAPLSTVYGTGTLTATFSNGMLLPSGTATLLDAGASSGSAPFVGNLASFSLAKLHAGLQILTVTYPGDTQNAPIASGQFLVVITKAPQTINFPALPSSLIYQNGLAVPLTATASSGLPVTYTVSGPATVSGSTLSITGVGTVAVTATAGNGDYETAFATQTIQVTPMTLTSLTPSTATLGDPAKLLTVSGTGFTTATTVTVNGTPLPTAFVNSTTLTTTLAASYFTVAQTLQVGIQDPSLTQPIGTLPFTVLQPPVSVTVTAPTTSNPGTQPTVTLTLAAPYPVPVTATFTLTFQPGPNGVDDPAIVFANGTRTLSLALPAGTTAAPPVQIQTGTVAGVIQVAVALTAGGANVTPANYQPTSITVPATPPTMTQVALTSSGKTLTVQVTGYSDTRAVTQAVFHFTSIPGQPINTPDVTVDVTADFIAWYTQAASNAYGSEFSYTQPFTLNVDASTIQKVSVTLTNSAGTSAPISTP